MFIILEKLTGWYKFESKKLALVQHIYTLFVVLIGWVMFRADTLSYALDYIKNMFGLLKNVNSSYDLSEYIGNIEILGLMAATLCAIPVFKNCVYAPKNRLAHIGLNLWLMLLFLLSGSSIAASTYNPFIYFRF